eukprot:1156641-Pelagomonas_calceolata.AAC.9
MGVACHQQPCPHLAVFHNALDLVQHQLADEHLTRPRTSTAQHSQAFSLTFRDAPGSTSSRSHQKRPCLTACLFFLGGRSRDLTEWQGNHPQPKIENRGMEAAKRHCLCDKPKPFEFP